MNDIIIHEATFIAGSPDFKSLPENEVFQEIAFVGKSNVGKSSFINKIIKRKNLVRTSGMPGCTKQINLFDVVYTFKEYKKQRFYFADLPGFGYAKASHSARKEFIKNIVNYLSFRKCLKTIYLLNDIRRDPGEDEFSIRDIAFENNRKFIPVFTKIDKVKKNELSQRFAVLKKQYSLTDENTFLSSGIDSGEEVINKFWETVVDA